MVQHVLEWTAQLLNAGMRIDHAASCSTCAQTHCHCIPLKAGRVMGAVTAAHVGKSSYWFPIDGCPGLEAPCTLVMTHTHIRSLRLWWFSEPLVAYSFLVHLDFSHQSATTGVSTVFAYRQSKQKHPNRIHFIAHRPITSQDYLLIGILIHFLRIIRKTVQRRWQAIGIQIHIRMVEDAEEYADCKCLDQ